MDRTQLRAFPCPDALGGEAAGDGHLEQPVACRQFQTCQTLPRVSNGIQIFSICQLFHGIAPTAALEGKSGFC